MTNINTCKRCIYDENVPAITFDNEGICNYCRMIENLNFEYETGQPSGEKRLNDIFAQIKNEGKNKKYDCVIGVSGGTDSSFMLYSAVKKGLRPLAVHYDNTWNTSVATENIRKVLGKLKVDLFTYVVDNREIDDITKAFLYAGVPELDGPTDIALAEVLYRAADKYGVKYILEGHSFNTEGVSPLGTFYIDGKYIESVHKKYGNVKMNTFPNMKLFQFMKWISVKRIKKIRPFWYLTYSKKSARELLQEEFGWEYYGGHHLENRLTAYMHSCYLPARFGIDNRINSIAAAVRSGEISRDEAFNIMQTTPHSEEGLIEYFKKRLDLTDVEYNRLMMDKTRTYKEFRTYKKTFEYLRPLFYVLYKSHLVPKSFYIKYTSKSEI